MIKINLANSLLKGNDSGMKAAGAVDTKSARENGIKIATLVLPIVVLMFYEKQSLDTKKAELAAITAEKAEMESKVTSFGSVDEIVRQKNDQKVELDKKVSVVKKIFSLRKQKLTALIALQTHIPRDAWLTKLEFTDQDLTISGRSSTNQDAQLYASLLSKEPLFSPFINKGVAAIKGEKTTEYAFEFKTKLKE